MGQKSQMGDEDAFVNAVGAVRFTIGDKMAGVSQRAMTFLSSICRSLVNVSLDGSQRSQFSGYIDPILATLSEKIGDNLLKARNSAEDAFMAAVAHPQFGVKICLSFIVNDVPPPSKAKAKGGKKPVLTSKHLAAKQSVLYKILCAH